MVLDWFKKAAGDVGDFFEDAGEEIYDGVKEGAEDLYDVSKKFANETIKFVSNDTIDGTEGLRKGFVDTYKSLIGAGESTVNFGFDGIEGSTDLLSDGLTGGVDLVGTSLTDGINITGDVVIGFYGSIPETGFKPMDGVGKGLADIPITGTNVVTVGATDVVTDGTRSADAVVDDVMDSLGQDFIQPVQDGFNDAMEDAGLSGKSSTATVGETFGLPEFHLPENSGEGFAVFRSGKNKNLPEVFTASKKLKSSTNEFINS